jgi:hypothetical protein
MWLFALLENVTTGPWYVDLGSLAGGLGASFWLYKNLVAPVGRAMWAAIIAAPKIAIYTGRLVELLEQDVIERLDSGNLRFQKIEEKLEALVERVAVLEMGPTAVTTRTEITRTHTEPAPVVDAVTKS